MAAAMDGFGMEGIDFPTETSLEQWKLEHVARDIYRKSVANVQIVEEDEGGADTTDAECIACEGGWETSTAVLHREEHVSYLMRSLRHLSAGHVVLDASRCWLCYWIVHALALLGAPLPPDAASDVVEFLSLCQHPDGGFGGGPGQMPHLAPTYAAVSCLAEIATDSAVRCVDRAKLRAFLVRCKDADGGGYRMHEGGETDTRGCYTALAVARMLGVQDDELNAGVGDFISRCQTHEGGIAGEPGAEAHGGYTFCGLAAAVLCDSLNALDLPELMHWLAHRQGAVEGGFNGRTNKLVDGCYSFWQGGAFPLLAMSARAVLDAMGKGSGEERTMTGKKKRKGRVERAGGTKESKGRESERRTRRQTRLALFSRLKPPSTLIVGASRRRTCTIRHRPRSTRARCRGGCCCAASFRRVVCRTNRVRAATTTTRVTASPACPSRSTWAGTGRWDRTPTYWSEPIRS